MKRIGKIDLNGMTSSYSVDLVPGLPGERLSSSGNSWFNFLLLHHSRYLNLIYHSHILETVFSRID